MKNKLILFDWGNIVESHTTGYSCRNAWNDLFQECGYIKEDVFEQIKKYKLCCIKNIDEFKTIYNQIKVDFNLNKSFDEFVYFYRKIFNEVDYYKDVASYELSLKKRCYIGIFSDLTIFDKERLNKQVNLSNYDYTFLSFELGLQKSDIRIFYIVQQKLPFKPKDILFIDDKKNNIKYASEMGWQTLQVTGLELDKIKQICEEFLN